MKDSDATGYNCLNLSVMTDFKIRPTIFEIKRDTIRTPIASIALTHLKLARYFLTI